MSDTAVTLTLTSALIDLLAERVAELVRDRADERSPWLTRKAAADYMGVPLSRLEKDRTIPCHRD